uniref:Latent transforming growth factor beta binding protein 4 n=1 Tax=Salarias fasciatus TaxID=181472 RepID=A0A672H888_SALFA
MVRICVGGVCVNTVGSYYCSCPPPLVLDDTQRNCVNSSHLTVGKTPRSVTHWTRNTAVSPLLGAQVTFTDCCCLYGDGWGMGCALCPPSDSGLFPPYGLDFFPPVLVPGRDFSRSDYEDYPPAGGSRRGFGGRSPASVGLPEDSYRRPDFRCGVLRPAERRPLLGLTPVRLSPSTGYFSEGDFSYGLSAAEDCGILHGCENGRCIRVAEGYTCDCYPGYELDMTSMTCIDVNECEDSVAMEFPCVNARCVNTDGSFRCVCRRGYVVSRRTNHCFTEKEKPK